MTDWKAMSRDRIVEQIAENEMRLSELVVEHGHLAQDTLAGHDALREAVRDDPNLCPTCGYLKDTPNHVLGCADGEDASGR